MAVAINKCAKLCGAETSVWRQALSTILTEGAVQLEVSMQQSSLSSIDFSARCAAGERRGICLRKLQQVQQEVQAVVDERWPGCTYTEVVLERGPDGTFCAQDSALIDLSTLTPPVQRQVKLLQAFRRLADAIADIADTLPGKRFLSGLDAQLDAQLGGAFADGYRWSEKLQRGAFTPVVLGEDLAETEAQAAVSEHRSRGCELLAALGRLCDRCHTMLNADTIALQSIGDMCDYLLSSFPWLHPIVCKLADEHLRDVYPLKAALEALDAVPIAEGLPPHALGPEPEPGPHCG